VQRSPGLPEPQPGQRPPPGQGAQRERERVAAEGGRESHRIGEQRPRELGDRSRVDHPGQVPERHRQDGDAAGRAHPAHPGSFRRFRETC